MTKKKFYFLGIGGIAMGTLAGMLKAKGHIVAGSDKEEIYPPMSDMLKEQKIKVFSPYNEFHLKQFKPNIVIVGNTIKRGNPELEFVISNRLPYRSLPDVLKEDFIEKEKKLPIVITGTHGKTTTTALISWILECAGLDPTIFIGGFSRNINSSFKLGKGKYIVIEGDEYNTSFFDKNPKFFHYRPHIGVINNIDHDHLDIYKNINETKFVFSKFANLIPKSGLLILNGDDKNIEAIVSARQKAEGHLGGFATTSAKSDFGRKTSANKKYFGLKQGDLVARNIKYVSGETKFDVEFHPTSSRPQVGLRGASMKLIGEFNVYNALAAISVALHLKIPTNKIKEALASFESVSRRAEKLGEKNGKLVINDFGHHPTAISETLKGLRQMFHKKRLIALFEPTSSSSKMKVMEKPIIKALNLADLVFIFNPVPKTEAKSFTKAKVSSKISVSRNIENLLFHLKHQTRSGDVIVMMSSKGFDGLKDKIWKVL